MKALFTHLAAEIKNLESDGLYKAERMITSPQDAVITTRGQTVLNFCANNYLGLANHPRLRAAAVTALENYGLGMASVRFICGTQDLHKELEAALSRFLNTEDTILYASCFDANSGLFETLFDEHDAIISDSLNHASIIDGIRLSKAQRLRYKNNDMQDLEQKLSEAKNARHKIIATDGVFSMDGIIADLPKICDLAQQNDALVMVDDSHAVGFIGKTGAGTPELMNVQDKVDIITGTLGKALGGALGGYTSGKKEIIEWLRQRSRPYLFSNSLPPALVATAIEALNLIQEEPQRLQKLNQNTERFRSAITDLGFEIISGTHPIVPIMLHDALLAKKFAEEMLKEGVYVIAFSYPVVPQGKARIRVQLSAAHEDGHLDQTLSAFATVGKRLGVIT